MQIESTADTIGAISTPPGKGGIGIVRISGPEALRIADRIFRGNIILSEAESHTIHYGACIEPGTGEMLDEVMAVVMRAPKTFTREDMVEFHTHGSMFIMRSVLDELYKQGIRPAEAGEFTMRAFLNGRLDLTRAEAISDLINAETEESRKAALLQLGGKLHHRIGEIRRELIELFALYEAEIDFYEEDIELTDRNKTISDIERLRTSISELLDTYKIGRVLREGARVGLFGVVNAGKSSLFNLLVGKDRAIVHNEPGTTRDIIEGDAQIDGVVCRFVDTAGFREETGAIETEGIRRSRMAMDEIDLALLVIDGSHRARDEEKNIYSTLTEHLGRDRRLIVIYNKSDLPGESVSDPGDEFTGVPVVRTSALLGRGLKELRKEISNAIFENGTAHTSGILITNSRHYFLLSKTNAVLEGLSKSIEKGVSGEFLALDFKEAIDFLGNITGETIGDDVLRHIFSKFCIGK